MDVTLTNEGRGDRVAAYETLHGAMLAVAHLRERGPNPSSVAIVPAGLEPVPDVIGSVRRRSALVTGVAAGAVASTVSAALVWWREGLSLAGLGALVLLGLAGGLAVGVLVYALDRHRAGGRALPSDVLRAQRFELVCDDRAPAVNHALARWWDPAARPAVVARPPAPR